MDYRAFPILCVDDESANRVVMKHNLGRQFELRLASSGAEALEILAREFIAVLLADQRMPGMTGVELAAQTLERYPDVVRVIITAYSDLDATVEAINLAHVNRFIKKPWSREELEAVVKESIHAYQSAQLIKQLQERLMQLDRISSLAILGSAIAHDLKQPLTFIEPNVLLLTEDAEELRRVAAELPAVARIAERMAESVADVERGISQFKTMAHTLLTSLQGKERKTQLLDLRAVVQNAAALTRGTVMERGRLTVHEPDRAVWVEAPEGRLYQLFVNLVVNAVHSLNPERKLHNRIHLRITTAEQVAQVEVEDTGCGIAADQFEEIFTPFVTTKGEAGSGLGLAICRQVVDELGGTIAVQSQLGEGTCFTVRLPLAPG